MLLRYLLIPLLGLTVLLAGAMTLAMQVAPMPAGDVVTVVVQKPGNPHTFTLVDVARRLEARPALPLPVDLNGIVLAPDGRRALLVTQVGSIAGGTGVIQQIYYIADLDAGTITRVNDAAAPIGQGLPAWSPDSTHVVIPLPAFTVGSIVGFYLVDAQTASSRIFGEEGTRFASWSPDGRYLLYYVDERPFVVDIQGDSAPLALAADLVDRVPVAGRWLPDGETLLIRARSDAEAAYQWYRVAAATGDADLLDTGADIAAFTLPTVSPDGGWLMYQTGPPTQREQYTHDISQGITYALNGGTLPDAGVTQAQWSPDGRHIALLLYESGGGNAYAAVVRRDGSAATHAMTYFGALRWTPDGAHLVNQHDQKLEIFAFSDAGTPQLTPLYTLMGVEGHTFARNSADLYVMQRDGGGMVFARVDLDDGDLHPLTMPHADLRDAAVWR